MPVCREDSITRHSVPTALETSTLSRCPGCIFPLENVISSKGMIFKKENLTGDMKDRWEVSVTCHQSDGIRHRDDGSRAVSACLSLSLDQNQLCGLTWKVEGFKRGWPVRWKESKISSISFLPLPIFCTWWWPFSPPWCQRSNTKWVLRFFQADYSNNCSPKVSGQPKTENCAPEYWSSLHGILY